MEVPGLTLENCSKSFVHFKIPSDCSIRAFDLNFFPCDSVAVISLRGRLQKV